MTANSGVTPWLDPAAAARNLQAALEATELSLDLKLAWLRRQHPGLSADEVAALMYSELREFKERAWKTC